MCGSERGNSFFEIRILRNPDPTGPYMIECSQFWEANQIVEIVLRNTDRIAVGLCGHIPSGAEASGNMVDMENLLMHQTVQMSRVDFTSMEW